MSETTKDESKRVVPIDYEKFVQETRHLLGEKGSPAIEWSKGYQVCRGGIRLVRKALPE